MNTILVAESMALFREPIVAALSHHYQATGAATGQQTIDYLTNHTVNLLILDLDLPDTDSRDLLKTIREMDQAKQMPVIALAENASREKIMEVGRYGVLHYILKTRFSLEELYLRIEKCLSNLSITESNTPPSEKSGVQTPAPNSTIQSPIDINCKIEKPNVPAGCSAQEALQAIKPIVSRSEIDALVDHVGELKAMSPVVSRILAMTRSANRSLDDVASVVRQDQAIALQVLKLANSAMLQRGTPAESVHQAVCRIGMSQLRQVVTSIAVIDQFRHTGTGRCLDRCLFWEHSIATGLIAASITRSLGDGGKEVQSAFTMGLLHDVGRMIFQELLGNLYSQLLKTADDLKIPLEWVESRMLLINHADIMDKVLHAWKFSKRLINPIALHHLSMANVRGIAGKAIKETTILALANRLSHAMICGSSGNDTIYPIHDFVSGLKIRPADLNQIEQSIESETEDLKYVMLQDPSIGNWPDARQELRQQLVVPMNPIFIAEKPEIDAYRMFTHRLADSDTEQPPNIAVVHFTNVRERILLSSLLREAEEKAGVKNLPLVIASSKGNIMLEDSAMKSRSYRLISSPTHVSRFIDAVNYGLEHGVSQHAA